MQHMDEHIEVTADELGDQFSSSDGTMPLWQRARS
jgi:hypothetical protein